MALETLALALDRLDGTVGGLEKALTKLEQRPKSSRKSTNQLDMFGMPAPVAAPAAAGIDPTEISHRLERVIAQIETVLVDAA